MITAFALEFASVLQHTRGLVVDCLWCVYSQEGLQGGYCWTQLGWAVCAGIVNWN